jgi:hypothetical protein
VERLDRTVVKPLDDPSVRDKLASPGLEGPPAGQGSPEALRSFQDSEMKK